MTIPELEIIVRVHALDRPVRRAVESVLEYRRAGVVVVSHGLVAESLDLPEDARVRVVEVRNRVGFPGVASNAGVAAVEASFTGLLDSDDFYEPNAVKRLHERARQDRADIVLAPLRIGETKQLLPLTLRTTGLKPRRDRLFYRTAPLGLVRTALLKNPNYHFDESVRTGEDMRVTARLWTGGHRVSYHPEDPAYVVGDGAGQRVTTSRMDASETFAAVNSLLDESWVGDLPEAERESLVAKIFRIHVLGFLTRLSAEAITAEDVRAFGGLIRKGHSMAPRAHRAFVRGEQALFHAFLKGDTVAVVDASARWEEGLPLRDRTLPTNLLDALRKDSNIRNVTEAKLHRLKSGRL